MPAPRDPSMNMKVIPIASPDATRKRKREAPKGRRVSEAARAAVREVLGKAPRQRDMLIEYLHRLQDRFRHLSVDHLAALAQEMDLAQTEVYEVASFYHHFDVVREGDAVPPALTVRVCDGLSCEMAGAQDLLAGLPAILGREVRVIAAPCIGRCEQAPAVAVGQHPIACATVDAVQAVVSTSAKAGRTKNAPGGFIDLKAYEAGGGYASLKSCIAGDHEVDHIVKALSDSGLRGLGGAGFPTGRKWSIVRNEPAPRLMAVNIDEGEPGTFKDRYYLERDPHRFLEGMLIAAWAVGIARIYIYLRDEYHDCRAILEGELAKLRKRPPYPGMPEIILRRGAGAYICGEESAMIESIEGKRGMPRLRPPYVAQVGLFGRPTLEHNFETLYWVREIVEKGGAWFASQGRHGRKGLRSFSVSGRVKKPGRQACAGRHHDARVDRRVLRRHARRPRLLRVSAGRGVGRHLAGGDGRHPAGLRHFAATRLLHRIGGRDRAVRPGPCDGRCAQHDALLCARILRPVHAVPQRHRQGIGADRSGAVGSAACLPTCRR